ncbi:MAG: metalloregulator ArsR/SmtB family transcription factor [Kiritimatiellales bacterium]|nr:metalloregulator ArsR/SmtB family transcription factor [Kiritimatiellales bacterium]
MTDILDIFKALADEGRLRILRAIDQAELSVAELVQSLEMPQSTVSRHLKPLREAGLVEARRDGTSVFYNRGPIFRDPAFAQVMNDRLKELHAANRDAASVEQVLNLRRKRSKEFFDQIAGRYGSLTDPGGGWQALAAALAAGFSGKEVADLGCGEGQLTLLLARFAKKVTAFDQSQQMLKLVQEKAEEQGLLDRVEVKKGILEDLPFPDGCLDAVFLSQSLHHSSNPQKVLLACSAALKKGGQLIILDLVRHEHEWTREEWADEWLGFDPFQLRSWLKDVGLETAVLDALPGSTPDLSVLMVIGNKQ